MSKYYYLTLKKASQKPLFNIVSHTSPPSVECFPSSDCEKPFTGKIAQIPRLRLSTLKSVQKMGCHLSQLSQP